MGGLTSVIPKGFVSGARDSVPSEGITNLLTKYPSIGFAVVPDPTGISTKSPALFRDRKGGIKLTPILNVPSLTHNVDGNNNSAIRFEGNLGGLKFDYELQPSYSMITVVRPTTTETNSKILLGNRDSTASGIIGFTYSSDGGSTFRYSVRHNKTAGQACTTSLGVPFETVGTVWHSWDDDAQEMTAGLGKDTGIVTNATTEDYTPDVELMLGGAGVGNTAISDVLAYFILEKPLYNTENDSIINTDRLAIMDDINTAFGATV